MDGLTCKHFETKTKKFREMEAIIFALELRINRLNEPDADLWVGNDNITYYFDPDRKHDMKTQVMAAMQDEIIHIKKAMEEL